MGLIPDFKKIATRSPWLYRINAGSCNGCELEIHALNNAFYDLERFGLSSPRYYQQLNALIDRPEALAYAPMLVKRLRRQRQRRQEQRSARHLGAHSVI